MREEGVRETFERLSADYDARFPSVIPRYAEFHATVVRSIADHFGGGAPAAALVDLGCGTGELSRQLLHTIPRLRVHCLDVSAAMVERAREKLARWGDQVSFAVGNALTAPLPAPAAGAVSALAVHHLDPFEKRALFARLHDVIAPGGIFVLADAVAGESPRADAAYARVWVEHMRGSGLSADDVASVLADHDRNDLFSRLGEQMDWLREAGFSPVECVWKYHLLAIVSAERSSARGVRPARGTNTATDGRLAPRHT